MDLKSKYWFLNKQKYKMYTLLRHRKAGTADCFDQSVERFQMC